MANTISQAFVEQFRGNVIHLAQQMGSRLEAHVRKETCKAEKHNFERIGSTDDEAKTTRHKDTPVADTPHSRRVVTIGTYHWADLIDNDDQLKMLINPQSEYAKAAAAAMGRRKDRLIIAAATGNSVDGDGNNVALGSGQQIPHASAGMTLDKLLAAKELLLSADVDEYNDEIVVVLSSHELHELLNDTTITSADYNSVRALTDGKIDKFLGCTFVRTELLATASGTPDTRSCLMYCKSGIGLAVAEEVKTIISDRADKSHATQVYLEYNAAATRLEEAKVVEILCDIS